MKTVYIVTYTNMETCYDSYLQGNVLAFDNEEEAKKLISELNTVESKIEDKKRNDIEKIIAKYVDHDAEIAKNICDQILYYYHDGNIIFDIETAILGIDMCKVPD